MNAVRNRPSGVPCLARALRVGLVGLVFALAAGAAPVMASDQSGRTADTHGVAGKDAADGGPSVQALEAAAHASDRLTFAPGDRVTVPFRPKAGDRYPVDGRTPVSLPAGRASGRAIAASPQGSSWADGDAPAGDAPARGGTPAADATPAYAPYDPVTAAAPAAAATNTLRRAVIGFLPYWELGASLNYDVLSTVAYFGVGVDTAGNLIKRDSDGSISTPWYGWTSSRMTDYINAAHSHGTRIALTIELFAWGSSAAAQQSAMLSSATARQNLAQQTAAAVRDRGADGVNVDFEPIASGQAANFVAFIRTLRAELNKIHAGYEITIDVNGYVGNYDADALVADGGADALFLMGYDFRGKSATKAGSIDPLTSPAVYDLSDAVKAFRALVPASKLILGLPWYGRAWSTTSDSPNAATHSGATYGESTNVEYATAANVAAQYGRRYDAVEQSAWVAYKCTCGTTQSWREAYYDDVQSLSAKYDMINYWGLRGTGIWALGYDGGHQELFQALADKFLTDGNPPDAGIVPIGSKQRDEGFTVAWKARDDWSGIKSYDVQVAVDGGPFAAWLTATTATSALYQGATGHAYAFRVRATDSVGNVAPWDLATSYASTPGFSVGGYAKTIADQLNERSAPDTSASIVRKAAAGTILQIIGGPRTADGYTWYQVTGPILEVNPVTPPFPGPWVAVGTASDPWVAPITAPNTTAVSAAIGSVTIGRPGALVAGGGADRSRAFSPNGDGIADTLPISWTNGSAFDAMTLSAYRTDGSLAGTVALGARASGSQSYAWAGAFGGTKLADGSYMLQLSGTSGGAAYEWPSPGPFAASQWSAFSVTIDSTRSGTYYPLAPVRLVDTRVTTTALSGALRWRVARTFSVAGKYGVPANATAVTGNLTVTGATSNGTLSLGPRTGIPATIDVRPNDTYANGVTLTLSSAGTLVAYLDGSVSTASVQMIFDLTGYFAPGAGGASYLPVAPTRLVDTRTGSGIATALTANRVYSFQVTGRAGIPSNAVAVTGHPQITGQTALGYLALSGTIATGVRPSFSTLNVPASGTRSNDVTATLTAGRLQVEWVAAAASRTHLVFDVTGYFVPGLAGATYVPIVPSRVADSAARIGLGGPLGNGTSASFAVIGKAGVSPRAVAVAGNLTAFGPTSGGWLEIAPGRVTSASVLHFTTGVSRRTGFTSGFGGAGNGTLTVTFGGGTTSATTGVYVDVCGYFI